RPGAAFLLRGEPVLQSAAAFAFALVLVAAQARAQTLRESVERALRNFPEVRSAVANRSAVQQTVTQASAGLLPSLDGTLGRGRERSNNSLTRVQRDGPWEHLNR